MEAVQEVLTRNEAAQFLRTPVATLAYWACRRQGPTFSHVGRRTVYRRSDLEKFLDANATGGSPIAARQ